MDYDLDDWKMILAPSALIICILWDIAIGVAKDNLKVKISSWVPSNLFVLSALTIQILSYVDVQKVSVFGPSKEKDMQELVDNQLRMDAARLTMCVFVGCLLPGMATVGTFGSWSNVAALFVSLSLHIATEIYALQNVNNSKVQSEAGLWFVSSGVVLVVGASSLLFLLGVVILDGKFMCDLLRPSDRDLENQGDNLKTLESEVMKSWVAARAWKTRYFLGSSMFSPGAGMIVTICVAVMAAKVGCCSSLLHHNNGGGNLTFYLQCIFILVGWILMLCRWFKGALYCHNSILPNHFLPVVGILFLPVAVVLGPLNARLAFFLLNPDFNLRSISISISCLVPLLPLCVLALAISLLVLFCFICWKLSDLVFGSQFVQHLLKLDKKAVSFKYAFSEYKSVLDAMHILDHTQHTFWIVSKKSFDRIKGRMDEAHHNAQSCTVLHSIMGNSGLNQNQRLRNVESWVGRMSSIFSDIANAKIGVDMRDAFEAYKETHDILKFVDFPNHIVVDPLNIFGTLNISEFMVSIFLELGMLNAEGKLNEGYEEKRESELTTQEREKVDGLVEHLRHYFSGGSNTVLTRLKECRSRHELGEMLRTLVGHVIVSCLLEAPDVIVKCTKQWAQNLDEAKIEATIELAGKVSGPLEKLVKDGDLDMHSEAETEQLPSGSAPEGRKLSLSNAIHYLFFKWGPKF